MTIETALDALAECLGDRLSRSKSDLSLHGRSETYFPETPPDGVAYPETTAEVSEIVRICGAHGCPVIAWGTGTSLEGHALAVSGGVVVDTSRMNQILSVVQEDMIAVVQPGVTREALNLDLRATGLFFPVDPGANASLGGMASTRASGTTAVRYGTMRDAVLALEVVLADGTVIRTGSQARKSSAGYDLTALFVGAEGTLGIITELTLRLQGQPEAISAATCAFERLEDAVNTVIATVQAGIPMARIEFTDAPTARAVNAYAGADFPEAPHLFVEFHGSETSVTEDAERFGELVSDFGGTGFSWAAKAEDRTALWAMRHNAYYAVLALRPGSRAVVTDACVPISRLTEAVRQTAADIEASGLLGPIFGHAGDGNFHAILLVEEGSEADLAAAKEVTHRLAERALRLGGTITGEHGIGLGKLDLMEAQHGAACSTMAALKQALDPKNLFNPGKMIRKN